VTRHDEDDVWRSIVENYGERPDLDDPDETPDPPSTVSATSADLDAEVASYDPEPTVAPDRGDLDDDEDRYVPPAPPPLPRPAPRRAAAWGGLVGAPMLMLVLVVFGIDLPGVLDLVLLAAFVGGFGYLVATMPKRPREPWDDGSQV
jgi:hypothetical protein